MESEYAVHLASLMANLLLAGLSWLGVGWVWFFVLGAAGFWLQNFILIKEDEDD